MSTHRKHEKGGVYFVTFTCYNWLPLIELSESYEAFQGFFNYLKKQYIPLLGYVIMPNHFHGVVYVPETSTKTLNELIGNAKRFLAYEIAKNLQKKEELEILRQKWDLAKNTQNTSGQVQNFTKMESQMSL